MKSAQSEISRKGKNLSLTIIAQQNDASVVLKIVNSDNF